jgi:hypothetical protein
LTERQWCHFKQGAFGATLVVFNKAFSTIKVPEMSIEAGPVQ